MAQFNSIQLTFNKNLTVGSSIYFQGVYGTLLANVPIPFNEECVMLRTSPYTFSKGTATATLGEISAINFVAAFNLDFSGFGFTVTRVANVVTIKSTISTGSTGWKGFKEGEEEIVPSGDVSISYFNYTAPTITVTNILYLNPAFKSCENVRVQITTSQLAENYSIAGNTVTSNTNNPFQVTLLRAQGYILQMWNGTNPVSQAVVETIGYLNPELFDINVVWSPNGSSINIVNNLPTLPGLIPVSYSLDNENWQVENTFTGLEPGEYTLYIRDIFGCNKSKRFFIADTGVQTPYFLYDKNNSFRMANRINFGTGGNYPNDENTLSNEAFAPNPHLAYMEIQRFQTNDVITTQFKSNYPTNKAFVMLCDGTETEILVVQKSSNIGKTDLRDAFICDLGNGKTGVYFTLGSIYDFATGLPTGDSFGLYGSLPSWYGLTKYILVDGAWYVIEDVIYDDSKNAEVIVINGSHTGPDTLIKAGALYNSHNYEVYEFTIDFDIYIDKKLRVRIEAISDVWQNITLLSELIDIKVEHEGCVEIRYWNDENTNINYQTGIRHLLRIPVQKINGVSIQEFENQKTDTSAVLIKSELYEGDVFIFEWLTKELWRKLIRALSCYNVYINNVRYAKNAEFETDGPLEDSNVYILTANMIKDGNAFSSQSDGLDEFDYGGSEIPGLLDAGGQSYIKS